MLLASQTAEPGPPATPAHLAHEISVDCQRALRRLDRLQSERGDVVLDHARALIGHAAALSQAIERGC
jgi:predicted ATPase